MIASPCLAHKIGGCRLDLRRLKQDIKAYELAMHGFKGVHARLGTTSILDPGYLGARERLNKEMAKALTELRLLYALRAHHRGRVHEIMHERYQRFARSSAAVGVECDKSESGKHYWREDTGSPTTRGPRAQCCAFCLRPQAKSFNDFVIAMLCYQRGELEHAGILGRYIGA